MFIHFLNKSTHSPYYSCIHPINWLIDFPPCMSQDGVTQDGDCGHCKPLIGCCSCIVTHVSLFFFSTSGSTEALIFYSIFMYVVLGRWGACANWFICKGALISGHQLMREPDTEVKLCRVDGGGPFEGEKSHCAISDMLRKTACKAPVRIEDMDVYRHCYVIWLSWETTDLQHSEVIF